MSKSKKSEQLPSGKELGQGKRKLTEKKVEEILEKRCGEDARALVAPVPDAEYSYFVPLEDMRFEDAPDWVQKDCPLWLWEHFISVLEFRVAAKDVQYFDRRIRGTNPKKKSLLGYDACQTTGEMYVGTSSFATCLIGGNPRKTMGTASKYFYERNIMSGISLQNTIDSIRGYAAYLERIEANAYGSDEENDSVANKIASDWLKTDKKDENGRPIEKTVLDIAKWLQNPSTKRDDYLTLYFLDHEGDRKMPCGHRICAMGLKPLDALVLMFCLYCVGKNWKNMLVYPYDQEKQRPDKTDGEPLLTDPEFRGLGEELAFVLRLFPEGAKELDAAFPEWREKVEALKISIPIEYDTKLAKWTSRELLLLASGNSAEWLKTRQGRALENIFRNAVSLQFRMTHKVTRPKWDKNKYVYPDSAIPIAESLWKAFDPDGNDCYFWGDIGLEEFEERLAELQKSTLVGTTPTAAMGDAMKLLKAVHGLGFTPEDAIAMLMDMSEN